MAVATLTPLQELEDQLVMVKLLSNRRIQARRSQLVEHMSVSKEVLANQVQEVPKATLRNLIDQELLKLQIVDGVFSRESRKVKRTNRHRMILQPLEMLVNKSNEQVPTIRKVESSDKLSSANLDSKVR